MKTKSWSKYFIYILLILIIVFCGQQVFQAIEKGSRESYTIRYYYITAMTIIFYGGVGLILGLEHLICEMKKEGTWIINFPKIVLMGIPSIYFSIAPIILYSNFPVLRDILLYPIMPLMRSYSGFLSIFPLILCYTIITSFYKHYEKM